MKYDERNEGRSEHRRLEFTEEDAKLIEEIRSWNMEIEEGVEYFLTHMKKPFLDPAVVAMLNMTIRTIRKGFPQAPPR